MFTEDIDLAIAGQLDEVKDPMGARPVQVLADTVNYLIFRARAAGLADGETGAPCGEGKASRAGRRAPPSEVEAVNDAEALITTDAQFRITSASPSCATIVGVAPRELLGQHLVDGLKSQLLVEAVLTCLGQLQGAGERHQPVEAGAAGPLHVTVARAAKDGPVSITLRRTRSGAQA